MVFEHLPGIRKREIQPRATKAVDLLLEERDRVVQSKLNLTGKLEEARAQLSEQASMLEFTAADLTTLILATANADYDDATWKKVGLYTGALLTILTRRDASITLELDLHEDYFPYLFFAAQEVGRLRVAHACGDGILMGLAYKGQAGSICATHLTGDLLLSRPADRGTIGQIVAIHLTGYRTLSWASSRGRIGQLVASHLHGHMPLFEAACQGTIGQLIATYLTSNYALLGAADSGEIDQLVTYNLTGTHPLYKPSRGIRQHFKDKQAADWLRHHKLDVLLDPHATYDLATIEKLSQHLLAQDPNRCSTHLNP